MVKYKSDSSLRTVKLENMRFGPLIYAILALVFTTLSGVIGARFGWRIDAAWVMISAAAFVLNPELTLLLGIVLGLMLDGLSGNGFYIYTISYGGFSALLAYGRRPFYIEGFFPGWIIALIGAQILWLFMGGFARLIVLIEGAARISGWISPFLLSVLIGYPVAYRIALMLKASPGDKIPSRHHRFVRTVRS